MQHSVPELEQRAFRRIYALCVFGVLTYLFAISSAFAGQLTLLRTVIFFALLGWYFLSTSIEGQRQQRRLNRARVALRDEISQHPVRNSDIAIQKHAAEEKESDNYVTISNLRVWSSMAAFATLIYGFVLEYLFKFPHSITATMYASVFVVLFMTVRVQQLRLGWHITHEFENLRLKAESRSYKAYLLYWGVA